MWGGGLSLGEVFTSLQGWYMRLIGWAMVVCCLGEEDGGEVREEEKCSVRKRM